MGASPFLTRDILTDNSTSPNVRSVKATSPHQFVHQMNGYSISQDGELSLVLVFTTLPSLTAGGVDAGAPRRCGPTVRPRLPEGHAASSWTRARISGRPRGTE